MADDKIPSFLKRDGDSILFYNEGEFIFYVQSVGNNAGRPLREPIPNSWEFRTFRSVDWEILTIVFISRILENFIIGSVIPFIRLEDYKKIIFPILENAVHENGEINKKYLQIRQIERQIETRQKVNELLKEMKTVTARQAIQIMKEENAL